MEQNTFFQIVKKTTLHMDPTVPISHTELMTTSTMQTAMLKIINNVLCEIDQLHS